MPAAPENLLVATTPDGVRVGITFDIRGFVTCGRCGTDRDEGDCPNCPPITE